MFRFVRCSDLATHLTIVLCVGTFGGGHLGVSRALTLGVECGAEWRCLQLQFFNIYNTRCTIMIACVVVPPPATCDEKTSRARTRRFCAACSSSRSSSRSSSCLSRCLLSPRSTASALSFRHDRRSDGGRVAAEIQQAADCVVTPSVCSRERRATHEQYATAAPERFAAAPLTCA